MKVTVGVSGGIAAYKAAELVRALQQKALDVHVVMTASAERFVQPLTFAALTRHKVITSLWTEPDGGPNAHLASAIEHIEEAQTTNALVVAPATADVLAKFAHGIADDFLTTLYLAVAVPVIVAPAMNVNMWRHPATQANVEALVGRGVHVVAPGSGYLACGMTGEGRLAEIGAIVEVALGTLDHRNDLSGETVLVTAGGTREALDPVRYIGNRSSGKMGYALADAARQRGARVILVTAPTALTPPAGCEVVPVVTAAEMREAVLSRAAEASLIIKAAAVSDYRPVVMAGQKIKRSGPLTIALEPTEDILTEVVAKRRSGQLIVGFAAETEDVVAHGRDKLLKKGADAIVINDVSRKGIGFDSDRNAATFLTRDRATELPEMTKRELADRILDEVLALRHPKQVVTEMTA